MYNEPTKLLLNSFYGVSGKQIRKKFVFQKQPRGSGRLLWMAERTPYGWDGLILQALRIKLRYSLGCPDIDRYITRLMIERRPCRFDYLGFDTDSVYYVLRSRGGGSRFKFPVYRDPADPV